MTDKKPGFFKRLFGGEQPVPPPAPPETLPTPVAVPTPVEPTPAPPPDDVPAPEPAPLPGPPETTPDYVEDIEERAAAPEPEPTAFVPLDPPAVVEVPLEAPRQGWFTRLASGLKRSSDQLTGSITSVFTKRKLDAATLDELEDVLIQADLGLETATAITETLRRDRFDRDVTGEDVRAVLAAEVEKVLGPVARPLVVDSAQKPFVILMIGVNGSGKTTTIGKLAQKFAAEGRSVMLAAGDTFRAAAIEQLQIWGQRTNAPVISRPASPSMP
jgi:fused signal recognition particle receptor